MNNMNENFNGKIGRKNTLISAWENQHPVMYWWFACTSFSLCSIYVLLLAKF
ncbi:MAG: hypothetical protein PHC34_11930 [Candidatus Gastranaerophilales bacterium]|nr:hypothetical protein [Candidatus Gastranaerophilales bacterium]